MRTFRNLFDSIPRRKTVTILLNKTKSRYAFYVRVSLNKYEFKEIDKAK